MQSQRLSAYPLGPRSCLSSLAITTLGALLAVAAACPASTRSYGGVVEEVGPINDSPAKQSGNEPTPIRSFAIRATFMEYISQLHPDTPGRTGRNHPVGLLWRQTVRTGENACILNGQLMDPMVFARALRPGLWGHIYEDQWFALSSLPRSQWGEVAAHRDTGEFVLRIHRTHNDFHLAKNPPVEKTLSYDTKTLFLLEGEPAGPGQALAKGNWVQVHPTRKQHVVVRTPAARFNADTLRHYWNGARGAVNDLTAPARLRGYRMDDPADPHAPAVQLEVTRLRRGKVEKRTFRGSFALLLDGRAAPPSIALRPGRAATLVTYRSDRSPHYVFLWSDIGVLRGQIRAVDDASVTIDLTDRLTGEKTGQHKRIPLDADAAYQLDGRVSKPADALKIGREISLYPARTPAIVAFRPQTQDRPEFTAGGAVEGSAVGAMERAIGERLHGGGRGQNHRMLRFDLDLGMPLQGPTKTTHRQLYISAVTRDGKLDALTVNNYAWHSHSPAWVAKVVNRELTYADGKLTGEITLDIDPRPEGKHASPVRGGRYRFTFNAPVRANRVAGRVAIDLDGKKLGQRDLIGRATVLPALIGPAPGEAVYTLTLEDPQQRVRPLTLHLEARGGQFVDAVASTGQASLYDVNSSQLALAGNRVHGTVRVSIPASQAGLDGNGALDITARLDIQRTAGGLTGSFSGTWGKPENTPENDSQTPAKR